MAKFYSIVVVMKSGRTLVGQLKPYNEGMVEHYRRTFKLIETHISYNITTVDGEETYFLIDNMESIAIKITEKDE